MLLIECCGLNNPLRPCGQILGYVICENKENSVTHVNCRSCTLEFRVEQGVATTEEKHELHELLQHLRRQAHRRYNKEERRRNKREEE